MCRPHLFGDVSRSWVNILPRNPYLTNIFFAFAFGRIFTHVQGGGGLRCSQYKYLTNSDFENFPSEILKDYHRPRRNHFLIDDEPDYTKAPWINNNHVFDYEAYVPNYRDGLAGPIISYWARVNNTNHWFAAPSAS